MRHNAEHGCRHCMVPLSDLGNIKYDIIANGRYHHITSHLLAKLRAGFQTKAEYSQFASRWGLSKAPANPLDKLCFDRHRQVPHDPAHVLLQNLSRVLIESTITVLSQAGAQKFTDILSQLVLPQGWSRFADPVSHLASFFFSDYGRLVMVGGFVLLQLDETHISTTALPSLMGRICSKRPSQVIKEIICCWVLMAQANAACFMSSVRWGGYDKMDSIIQQLAAQLLKVSQCLISSPLLVLKIPHRRRQRNVGHCLCRHGCGIRR